jgi:alcohol dehydrogenase (cytochrome c)
VLAISARTYAYDPTSHRLHSIAHETAGHISLNTQAQFRRAPASNAVVHSALAAFLAISPMFAEADDSMATSGAKSYAAECAMCHGASLDGGQAPNYGPALRGEPFQKRWASVAQETLADYIVTKMPLNRPGSLDAPVANALAQYLRQENKLPNVPTASAESHQDQVAETIEQFGGDRNEDETYHTARARLDDLAAHLSSVDTPSLTHPRDADWLIFGHDWAAHRFSPLDQITQRNAQHLTLAWSVSFATGTNGIEPLVHDGVLFINSNGTVQALDATTGDLIWEFARRATSTRVPSSQTRSMAFYRDSLIVPGIDNHVIALDVRTGKLRWDSPIGTAAERLELTAAPLVVHDKIIQGVSGCQGHAMPGGCFIVALDAVTGREVWRFYTLARPGQLGGNSWNDIPLRSRFGGSVWNTGSYDPGLNLLFFGTGQTYMISGLLKPAPKGRPNKDALFTNSTVALDPDTGRLVWHYQHFPTDVWDLDWSFEQTIVSVADHGGTKKAIVTAGKLGIVDAVDAATGHYLWSYDLGFQNLVTHIDPTSGRKQFDPELLPKATQPSFVCPSAIGGRNWPASAYDELSGTLFFPLNRTCMDVSLTDNGDQTDSKTEGADFTLKLRIPRDSDGRFGELASLNVASHSAGWRLPQRYAQISAVLATRGGLVFEGSNDRSFRAVDTMTGRTLWQTRLNEVPNGYPITYMAGGKQYVAIVAGGGSPLELFLRHYTPEIRSSTGAKTLMVFALPSDTSN